VLALAAILGSLAIVGLAELVCPRRRKEFPALRRRAGNIGLWVLNVILAGFVFATPASIRAQIQAVWGIALPTWPIASPWVSFIVAFLLLDVLHYAVHRWQHAAPFLWRFHALHHSDPDVDVTTSVRHHPAEYLFAAGIYWAAALTSDIPATAVLTHAVAVFVAASVTHGNMHFPERFERWLQPLVITLYLHLIHHSVVYQEANSNYGAVLSIWDRLFGTFMPAPGTRVERLAFGIRELQPADCLKLSGMLRMPWQLRRATAGDAG
jgi:sterol desaturase/sphingolipid hydroxylase (fatty acid hydroxylase superfamily)